MKAWPCMITRAVWPRLSPRIVTVPKTRPIAHLRPGLSGAQGVMDHRCAAIHPNHPVADVLGTSRDWGGWTQGSNCSGLLCLADPARFSVLRSELTADGRHRDGSDHVARNACSGCPDEFPAL